MHGILTYDYLCAGFPSLMIDDTNFLHVCLSVGLYECIYIVCGFSFNDD